MSSNDRQTWPEKVAAETKSGPESDVHVAEDHSATGRSLASQDVQQNKTKPVSESPTSSEVRAQGAETVTTENSNDKRTPAVIHRSKLSRRRMITVVISVSAGIIAALWPALRSLLPKRLPYIWKKSKQKPSVLNVDAAEGFYGRVNRYAARAGVTGVLQYVDNSKRVRFVPNFSKEKRQLVSLTDSAASTRHVDFSRASVFFEMAAIQQIRLEQYDRASQLLISGIRHDIQFKRKTRGPLSFRLWDLLAKLSIRRNQPDHFKTLLGFEEMARNLIAQQRVRYPARRKKVEAEKRRPRRQRLSEEQIEQLRKKRLNAFEIRLKRWRDDQEWQPKMKDLAQKQLWTITLETGTKKSDKITVDI